MRFEIVTGIELVKVHNPSELFASCHEAGVGIVEATLGMVALEDGLYLRVENTRRIPKIRKGKGVAKTISKRPPEGRILELASRYAAIPAAFYDRLDSDYSPLDD
jgi:hypothetical protein